MLHTSFGHVFHSYFGKLTTGFYKMIERWLAKRTTAIIAISEQQRIELVEKHKIFKPDKARVVPLGFDLTRFTENKESKRTAFRDEYRLTEKDVAIVIVGRLVPIKNHKMFLNSIRLIIDSGKSNARFFIVGDGESREGLMRYSESQGIGYTKQAPPTRENPLCFTSWIRDVDRVYAGCDIVCLTSYNEGTPVSLIEAQATEKPIVSTRVGGINDIVLENQSAFLVDSDDFSALAGRISELIENNLLRTQMGMSGSDNVLTRFTYANLCSNMRSIYIDELKRRNIPYS
ncbi:MAG: glycosyltransferase [Flavobacteriales bacterium]